MKLLNNIQKLLHKLLNNKPFLKINYAYIMQIEHIVTLNHKVMDLHFGIPMKV
jgi:hypothetical protein